VLVESVGHARLRLATRGRAHPPDLQPRPHPDRSEQAAASSQARPPSVVQADLPHPATRRLHGHTRLRPGAIRRPADPIRHRHGAHRPADPTVRLRGVPHPRLLPAGHPPLHPARPHPVPGHRSVIRFKPSKCGITK